MYWLTDLVISTLVIVMSLTWTFFDCHKKSKKGIERITGDPHQKNYKPGHLPEFADPDEKDMDTFYGVNSVTAFPLRNPDGTLQNPPRGMSPVTPIRTLELRPGESQQTESVKAVSGTTLPSQHKQSTEEPKQ